MSWAPALGLHAGGFGLQLVTFLVDERSTQNPTMASVHNIGLDFWGFFKTVVEGEHGIMCIHQFGFALRSCDLQQTLGYSPWTSLCSYPKSGVPSSFKSPGLMPLVYRLLVMCMVVVVRYSNTTMTIATTTLIRADLHKHAGPRNLESKTPLNTLLLD